MPSKEASVPRYIDAVVERALQPKVAERFDSAQGFLAALDPGQTRHPHKWVLLIAATALTRFFTAANFSDTEPELGSPVLGKGGTLVLVPHSRSPCFDASLAPWPDYTFNTIPGYTYLIESSDDLTNWSTAITITATGNSYSFETPDTERSFFRATRVD